MSTDHLTTTSHHELAAGVLSILAGAGIEATAASTGVNPADLLQALQVYQAAGLAALERRADTQWRQLRIEFTDWSAAETIGATQLGPHLDQLQSSGAVTAWWFLRKYPCWRLRLRGTDTAAVEGLLDELTAAGLITRWWPTLYEPETTAFGGPIGMHAAHSLFCADSRGVLDYLRRSAPGLGRRELSLLLISALLGAAGLDWFERGDVFARVARLRPTPADDTRLANLADSVRALLAIPVQADSALFAPGGPTAFAAPWLAAHQTVGRQLGHAATQGRLDRGLRALLTHIVIFHWNRFGLSATTQGILARAASTATLPRS
ncbi:thiopeptide-type bacteriocin biosynthesis protein (plasmid) [Streptosporangium sp. CA-135522]|uniref:thiopeptide-type bacteriocin biosynthesis protein n=1 Tax=Streptosporangium sp. CA-135522 TaxID=3240072 RepID=UPI003D8BE9EF